MQEMRESRRVYTGVHLLLYLDRKRQFGSVDAWADQPDLTPVVRLFFGKHLGKRLQVNDDGDVAIEMTLDEAAIVLENVNSVVERIKYLVLLANRDSLADEAYYPILPVQGDR